MSKVQDLTMTDMDACDKMMAEKGIGIWQQGKAKLTNGRVTYYDSLEKLGFIVEALTGNKQS